MNILMVTGNDKGAVKVCGPIFDELRKRGHMVHVVAEGSSMQAWKERGTILAYGIDKVSPTALSRGQIEMMIDEMDPAVLITTASALPVNLEFKFACWVRPRTQVVLLDLRKKTERIWSGEALVNLMLTFDPPSDEGCLDKRKRSLEATSFVNIHPFDEAKACDAILDPKHTRRV
jgi:hypothetical protein